MKIKNYCIFVILVVLITLPENVFAEHVFFKSGKIIECKIISENSSEITVILQNGTKQVYKQGDVMRVLYTNLYMGIQHIRLVDGRVIQAYMVDEDQDTFTFRKDINIPREFKIPRTDVLFMARKNPNKLTGKADFTTIELSWLAPFGEVKGYNIYIKKEHGAYSRKPLGYTTETAYTINGLKSNTDYRVIVTAVNKDNRESLPSNELVLRTPNYPPGQPGKPRMKIAHDRSGNLVDVETFWEPAIDIDGGIAAYNIYLKIRGEKKFKLVEKLSAQQNNTRILLINHTLKDLKNGTDYIMTVTALDDNNVESEESGYLYFSTLNKAPGQPKFVKKKRRIYRKGKKLAVTLTWDRAHDSDGNVVKYVIYRKKVSTVKLGETTGTFYKVEGLDPDIDYTFIVASVDNRGAESIHSGIKRFFDDGMNLVGRGYYLQPLGVFGDMFEIGGGVTVSFLFNAFKLHGLCLGIEAGYWHLSGKHELVDSSFMVPVLAEVSYMFDITRFFRLGAYVSAGMIYTSVTHAKELMPAYSVSTENINSFDAASGAGISFEFLIKSRLVIEARVGYLAVLESKVMHSIPISIGVGYRFGMPGRSSRIRVKEYNTDKK